MKNIQKFAAPVVLIGLVVMILSMPYTTIEYYTEKEPYIIEHQVPTYKTVVHNEPIYSNVYIEVEYIDHVSVGPVTWYDVYTEQVFTGQEIIGYDTWIEQVFQGYEIEKEIKYKDVQKSRGVSECLLKRIFT